MTDAEPQDSTAGAEAVGVKPEIGDMGQLLVAPPAGPFHDVGEAIRTILRMLSAQLTSTTVFVAVFDREQGSFLVTDALGASAVELDSGLEEMLEETFCWNMVHGRAPQLSDDADDDILLAGLRGRETTGIRSYLGVPLELSRHRTVGTVCAVSAEPERFVAADLESLRLGARLLAQDLEHRHGHQELQEIVASLRQRADTDSLTELPNRLSFEATLDREWKLLQRGDRDSGYLVVADIDRLKHLNDTHGHAEGDRALVSAARALGAACRSTDVAARRGGDEFAVLLAGASSDADAERYVQRVREALASGDGYGENLRLSFGFAPLAGSPTPGTALDRADFAMYIDKRRSGAGGRDDEVTEATGGE